MTDEIPIFGDDGIKDFSIPDKPKPFRIGPQADDVFEAPPIIAPVTLVNLPNLMRSLSSIGSVTDAQGAAQVMEGVKDVFRELLTTESGDRFAERLDSKDRPVDLLRQVIPIVQWMMEVYGLRPTQVSSSSPELPGADGTSSTDGVPAEESIPSA
jgi:hypothetical protein